MKENDNWFAEVQSNFEQAMKEDNVGLCRDIIADMKGKGFTSQAIVLERNLNEYLEGSEELNDNGHKETCSCWSCHQEIGKI